MATQQDGSVLCCNSQGGLFICLMSSAYGLPSGTYRDRVGSKMMGIWLDPAKLFSLPVVNNDCILKKTWDSNPSTSSLSCCDAAVMNSPTYIFFNILTLEAIPSNAPRLSC